MFLFLESIGTSELLFIAVAALVLFGPRKLPELARSLGRSLNEFKRASEDFKQTWQREVEMEKSEWRKQVAEIADDLKETDKTPSDSTLETDGALLTATVAPPEIKSSVSANELSVRPPQGISVAREGVNNTRFNPSTQVNQNATESSPNRAIKPEANGSANGHRTSANASRKRDWL